MTMPLKLGVVFSYEEDWIGGSYYLLNLISALKVLRQEDRPALTVFAAASDHLDVVRSLGYPNADYILLKSPKPGRLVRLINRVSGILCRRPLILPAAIGDRVDIVYPATHDPRFREISHWLFWIPDFQEEYLPQMFSPLQLANRRRVRGRIARTAKHIVFSSEDAAGDFKRFYPKSKAKSHVLNFAVTHPEYEQLDINRLRQEYSLGEIPFFLVSNQFWKHKNHRVVVEALRLAKASCGENEFLVCFSGKEADARNPGYAEEIRDLVSRYGLEDSVRFLGFIERAHQVRLMADSVAVIQPSLFEGWSTVIEDAKALSVPIIASDLPVHREQLREWGTYFARNDHEDLAQKMEMHMTGDMCKPGRNVPYSENVKRFGAQFVGILREINGAGRKKKCSSDSSVSQVLAK